MGDTVVRAAAEPSSHGHYDERRLHKVLRIIPGREPIAEVLCIGPVAATEQAHWPYWVALRDLRVVAGNEAAA